VYPRGIREPQSDPHPPAIYRLPRETLANIIDLVLIASVEETRNGLGSLRQLLVLGAVSTYFRTLAFSSHAWHSHDAFDLSKSIKETFGRRLRELAALEYLLSIKAIAESLGRIKRWNFSTMECLSKIGENIPEFFAHGEIKSIVLERPLCNVSRFVPRLLQRLEHLSSLQISVDMIPQFDYDSIATMSPSLETLVVHNFTKEGKGKLTCENLKSLTIQFIFGGPDRVYWGYLLPVPSAATLTELSLENCLDDLPLISLSLLNRFVNLKTMSIRPLQTGLATLLMCSNLKLKNFSTTVDGRRRGSHFVKLINSPCLVGVESMYIDMETRMLGFNSSQEVYRFSELALAAMASCLKSLRCLELKRMKFRQPWGGSFRLMKNLEELKMLEMGAEPPEFMIGVNRVLEEAFVDFEERPIVQIKFSQYVFRDTIMMNHS
jgi:hypothetical protein